MLIFRIPPEHYGDREVELLALSPSELDALETALLIASRSDDIDSETAAFVTRLQELIVKVRG